jgi:Tol biopolymer transport system component/predicted Ser/Thr protein kinase
MSLEAGNLEPGSTLGPFQIVTRIGAGGMGEVWKARDTRLERDVAIKTVHARLDARFAREARAIAALNHPNICQLYDVGTDYLVMEYIEGQNLHGPVKLDDALGIATQIARALEAAHDKGIVHRDLKPGNIRITPDGTVKVLDFGLARMSDSDAEEVESSPTLTMAGTVVGTPSYMSPEQARGLAVDKRTDIWAFGVILFELLTGAELFEGKTKTDVLAAVIRFEPDLNRVPVKVRRLLRTCLEKDRNLRLRDIGDWKLLLDSEQEPPPLQKASWATRARFAGWLAAAGIAGAVLIYAGTRYGHTAAAAIEPLYQRLTDDNGLNDYPALSRDGKLVAYSSDRAGSGNLNIWLQQIGGREAIQLTHDTEDETDPSFSSDGTRIAYRSERDGGGIYSVQTLGGDPVLIAPGGRNPRYSPDGRWLAYWTGRGEGSFVRGSSRVFIVDANGGTPRQIHPEMAVAEYPVWSPRSDSLLVQGFKDTRDSSDFWVLPIDSGAAKATEAEPLFKQKGWSSQQTGMRVEPAPVDWIDDGGDRFISPRLFGDSANLWETGLGRDSRIQGLPHRITSGPGRQAHASWVVTASFGRLAFADESVNYDLWSVPAGGTQAENPARLTDSIGAEWAPSLSGDGKSLLFIAHRAGSWDVVLRNVSTGRDRTLTSSPGLLINAAISGDGGRAAWTTSDLSIFATTLAGHSSGQAEKLCDGCGTVLSLSFDGRYAAFEPRENEDLMSWDVVGRRAIQLAPRPKPDAILSGTQFSSDGKWVAFHSIDHATRTTQLWIAPVRVGSPAPPREWIEVAGGQTFAQDPTWSPDGNILYFVSERDGFRCYWGQHLNPVTKSLTGEPFAVRHFHSARQTLRGGSSSGYLTRLAAGGGRLVYSVAEVRGTIWLEETPRGR